MATGTLTNTKIKDRYKSILKITGTSNDELHATTLKLIEDGNGNDSALQLAQNRLEIVPVANHANAFEVSQADGTQIFNINSTTPGLTVNAAAVTLTQDTNFVTSGGVNGMSIDGTTFSVDASNDRVGIGTAAPHRALEISHTSGGSALGLFRSNADIDNDDLLGEILFSGSAVGVLATEKVGGAISAFADGNWTADSGSDIYAQPTKLAFFTQSSTVGTSTLSAASAKMIILANGNVGIGTTSPNTQLDISHATGAHLQLTRNDSDIQPTETIATIMFTGTDPSGNHTGALIKAICDRTAWDDSDNDNKSTSLNFYTQDDNNADKLGSPRMTIDRDGKVGIGTALPDGALEVSRDGAIASMIKSAYDDTN